MSLSFQSLPGANIETNSNDSRAVLEATNLKEDCLIVSLNFMRLYTNLPVNEANKCKLDELYFSDELCELSRSTMTIFLRLAGANIYFMCNK